jgi:hypothetical protein
MQMWTYTLLAQQRWPPSQSQCVVDGTHRLPANVEEHAAADLQHGIVNDGEVVAPLAAKSRDAAERDDDIGVTGSSLLSCFILRSA